MHQKSQKPEKGGRGISAKRQKQAQKRTKFKKDTDKKGKKWEKAKGKKAKGKKSRKEKDCGRNRSLFL